jgi:Dyp-type peroxidase family
MEKVEEADIQGLVAGGHGKLKAARFLLLEVVDAARARGYLRGIRVTRADEVATVEALQVAFTAAGLAALEVPATACASFAREFKEGMDDDVRKVSLGDEGDNDPSLWTWGRNVHVLLLCYAKDDATLETRLATERAGLAPGFRVVAEKSTTLLPGGKEHFGWKDGISTPIAESRGTRMKKPEWTDPIRMGEFVLGYQNEYKHEYETYNESPTVALADDPANLLPVARDGAGKDLGRNGTYLVYRELTQDVPAFWDYLATNSREPGADAVASAIALGAKMVGRWPGGAPLSTSPGHDDPAKANDNAFTYAKDRAGLGCPLGSHIRRSNPRDHLAPDRGADESVEMVRKHQLLRRGRPFGKPLVESMDPRDILARKGQPDTEPRGLHFICLVAHIGRQFEFVQRTWVSSANFLGLFNDADPIVGTRRRPPEVNANNEFTCPAEPVRRKYKGLPQFTRLVGGAYFFLPGLKALRFIARDA